MAVLYQHPLRVWWPFGPIAIVIIKAHPHLISVTIDPCVPPSSLQADAHPIHLEISQETFRESTPVIRVEEGGRGGKEAQALYE